MNKKMLSENILYKKKTVLCMVGVFLLAALLTTSAVAEESRFVRPSVDIPVRRGQGNTYKIIKMVKDGDQVVLLKESGDWARIRVSNGTEGWMPKRFLSAEAPPVKLVQILRTENEQLIQKNTELNRELTELKELQTTTGGELSACIARRDTIQASYQELKAETADVVAIKNRMAATEEEIKEVRTVLVAVQQQNKMLKQKTALLWFLAGGGVLLLGWMIGLVTGGSKKRSTLR